MQMNTPFDHRELTNLPDIAKNKAILRLISSIRDRKDGIIIRGDIFAAIFPFASEAEKYFPSLSFPSLWFLLLTSPCPLFCHYFLCRIRIYTFAICRAVLLEVLQSLRPVIQTTFGGMGGAGGFAFDEMQSTSPIDSKYKSPGHGVMNMSVHHHILPSSLSLLLSSSVN
jgi:hypothetical protein